MIEAPYAVTVPQQTVNDESVRIISWKVPSGAPVAKDQPICEIETSKTVIEMYAPIDGLLNYDYAAGDEVAVGATLCSIMQAPALSSNGSSKQRSPALNGETLPAPTLPIQDVLPPARLTPSARRVAAEYRIEISAFPPGSLVRKTDVLRKAGVSFDDGAFSLSTPRQKRQKTECPKQPALPVTTVGLLVDWQSLPQKKVIEGKILAAGRQQAVQSSVSACLRAPMLRARVTELDVSDVAFDALILFEVSRLLRRYPQLNAVHEGGRIGRYRHINICWAVDSGNNLVAPVVKDCDQKTFDEIIGVMEGQVERYVENRLALEELSSGTFTISNLSSDGVCFFNPLISQDQSAILGISSDTMANGDENLYLTLAFDHQLTEGRTAALFLKELAIRLEAQGSVQTLKQMPTAFEAAPASVDAYCVICQRTYPLLQRSRAVLLKSEFPPGLVCSLCVVGF